MSMEEQLELNPNSANGLSESSPPPYEEDDDAPVLSSHALAALKEFLAEQQSHSDAGGSEVALVSEDWRMSQFWYTAETAKTVAEEVLTLCDGVDSRVACIACPTLYPYLKKMDPNVSVQLLEYDKRFEQYGSDYTFYDYNHPEKLPSELKHSCKVVVADPPYLSKECLEKVAETISFLRQLGESFLLLLTGNNELYPFVFCITALKMIIYSLQNVHDEVTSDESPGEVQKERAAEILGLRPCGFRPQHSSKLGNEFRLFSNYDPGTRLGGWEK